MEAPRPLLLHMTGPKRSYGGKPASRPPAPAQPRSQETPALTHRCTERRSSSSMQIALKLLEGDCDWINKVEKVTVVTVGSICIQAYLVFKAGGGLKKRRERKIPTFTACSQKTTS